MRISTSQIFDQNLTAILNQQTELAKTQNQISTGKRILNPSDDPSGSVQILSFQRELSLTNQYLDNAVIAGNKLERQESTLDSATNLIQRLRELAVQGLNDSNSQSDRQAIATEIREINEQLLSLANTKDANGDYLFAGYATGTQPYKSIFDTYQGDEGQRNLKVGEGVLIETNDPANRLFEARLTQTTITSTLDAASTAAVAITGDSGVLDPFSALTVDFSAGPPEEYTVTDGTNTATFAYTDGEAVNLSDLDPNFPSLELTFSGTPVDADQFVIEKQPGAIQTVFRTIDNFAAALEANQVGPANTPNNGDFLTNIDAVLSNILDGRAKVGGRLNSIEQQTEINETLAFMLEKDLSSIKDLDYAEAISRLSRQSLSLQAAQQSFAQVKDLTLFNFL